MTTIIETDRLNLRELEEGDAPFLHALLTDADFLRNIGHRGVDTIADATRAIRDRYRASYAANGWGMYLVEDKADRTALGMAGLVKRDGLDDVDVGFALLPGARGRGFAFEAAQGVLDWATQRGIAPVVAIVSPGNSPSIGVLGRLGYRPERSLRLPGADDEVMLYVPAASQNG